MRLLVMLLLICSIVSGAFAQMQLAPLEAIRASQTIRFDADVTSPTFHSTQAACGFLFPRLVPIQSARNADSLSARSGPSAAVPYCDSCPE